MLVKTDKEIIASYFEDYSGLTGAHADTVLFPENLSDIVAAVTESHERRIPLTVSGGGTGVTGGRLAFGGRLLSMEKMTAIKKISSDPRSCRAIVEPGVTLQQLDEALKPHGLWYPVNPTERSATLGGNVATNASGSYSFKYSSTRRYVSGLTVILPTGAVLTLSRGTIFADPRNRLSFSTENGSEISLRLPDYTMPLIKNAAGYYRRPQMDLIDLFIGSEGTLGVVAEIELTLLRRPETTFQCCVFYPSSFPLIGFLDRIRRESREKDSPIDPMCIEYIDRRSLDLVAGKYPGLPASADGLLYFEQESSSQTEDSVLESWAHLFEEYRIDTSNVWFAQSEKEKAFFTELRHHIPESINEMVKRNGMPKIGSDLAVPDDGIGRMIENYYRILGQAKMPFFVFGHIGQNHLHANLLPAKTAEFERGRALYEKLVQAALALGGTISAEHGIGKLKHSYLRMMYHEDGLRQMAALKKTLDPAAILGLDNVFPREYLR